jgi:hypothetical protein
VSEPSSFGKNGAGMSTLIEAIQAFRDSSAIHECKLRTIVKYHVEINGRNFLIETQRGLAKHGFFTTRFVEAVDRAAVELAAVQTIRENQGLRDLVRNASDDPPIMDVTSIDELAPSHVVEGVEPGFVWYSEDQPRWWQFWKR